jgi:hypothetical protein
MQFLCVEIAAHMYVAEDGKKIYVLDCTTCLPLM